MSLPKIDPATARHLVNQGAILVDIREAEEFARENIVGAYHLPLSRLHEAALALKAGKALIFHCKSGARTSMNAARLAAKVNGACEAYILDGGLDAWKRSAG
ncbi:rhodanese-like domain-containing protein [Bradyrhizobium betae]|uniref:Sulfurtransferase n=1 Tax=Bradyrhizobium betae TaxID=244734 RepID=A0A5P6NZM4_9BRAD|nr:rhodanese-like domain-containing protein [Bradyrhizobium betae]MCS3725312.1 rhodanese-related sulfurtransferase [Bradyrhizobium betae]QFI71366.1 sulfurtransferase [Bradyrhizobium betae]